MILEGMHVAVLATDGVEQSELTEPIKALRETGAEVEIVSIKEGQIQGVHHATAADKFDVDYHITDVRADDYDAVVIPGGPRNADQMRRSQEVQDFLRAADADGKPLAVICHGPWELTASDLVSGRRLTSYPKIQDDIRSAGGHWEDKPVVVDGNWVSSRRPSDLPAFNQAMLRVFADYLDKAGMADPYDKSRHMGGSHPGIEVETQTDSQGPG